MLSWSGSWTTTTSIGSRIRHTLRTSSPRPWPWEREPGGTGKDLILGIILGHEFEMRLCEAAFPGIRERGWHHATLTAFVSPIVAGRMLGLSWEQIQHAIGISASRHASFGAAVAGKLTMMKNTVDPMATQSGVLAALLAEKGYTGPEHIIDGKEGLVHCYGTGMETRNPH